MTKPDPTETREEFITRFVSNPESKSEYPDTVQRLAVANSFWRSHAKTLDNKEECYSKVYGLEFKQVDDDNYLVKGYISTTHTDSGYYDFDKNKYVQDKISKDLLIEWKDSINQGVPKSNKASINHDRSDKIVIGVGQKGSADVHLFKDGEYGLFVNTILDKTHPEFKNVKNRIDIGTIDSFSIEFVTQPNSIKYKEYKDHIIRELLPGTELYGYSIVSRPMNEHSIMVKSLIQPDHINNNNKDNNIKTEVKTMTEQVDQITVSKQEYEKLMELKQLQVAKAEEERIMKIIEAKMQDSSFNDKLNKIENKGQVLQNTESVQETPEQKSNKQMSMEFKNIITNPDLCSREKFRQVGLLAERKGLIWAEGIDSIGYKTSSPIDPKTIQVKNFQIGGKNGNKLEYKSLGITTNQNTDTDYLLSAAELRDMFEPVIWDALNLETTTWGLLRKEDYSNKGNNQVQFILQTGENAARGFYTGNSVTTGNSTRLKMQTKFKKYQVGISVDGDMIAASKGGPVGDVFGLEIEWGTKSMIDDVDAQLFAETGLETAAQPIGFEFIADSAGNATMYSLTRSTTNKLSPDSASDTYINGSSARISLDNMAKAMEQAIKEGANLNNLVFITHPTQERLYKGIYRSMQRLIPTSTRFGFEGRADFDGVPIFVDKNCNTDDWWLIDLETHRVAIWVPPTLEMLGKRSDAEEGFIKMYYAVYNTVPRRLVMIYGNATS